MGKLSFRDVRAALASRGIKLGRCEIIDQDGHMFTCFVRPFDHASVVYCDDLEEAYLEGLLLAKRRGK